jgi:methylmalonyl-CoA mutase
LRRDARAYEQLRDAVDAVTRKIAKRPSVFLCNLGPIAQHKTRAQFAGGVFHAGGLSVLDNDGFETPESAVEAFARSGAQLCAICGTDEAYGEWLERLLPLLRQRGAARILLAGRPGAKEANHRAAGLTDYIYMGCNVVETLTDVLRSVGVVS